ncbi:MAG: isoprenylcysteine carboxylmethyltransferase family protein [Bradyrhizobiaceae bacterium]|nr:isoprenylcysteine carboxylmethyltransferase family protein [Bradyrhizobiaceae bacterium]
MTTPELKLWLQLIITSAVIALTLFLCAGTIAYWEAWLYLAVGAFTSIPLTRLMLTDPTLLESRTRAGPAAERRSIQKVIVACLAAASLTAFVLPGLDHRFGWSSVPSWLAICGNALIVLAMWLCYRVFQENRYGSATVEIGHGQHVVSTGPYAVVRHPMYSAAALYFVGMTLALGSWWGLVPAALMTLGFVWRLFDEEKFLAEHLPGYTDYCAKVRWRLMPGVF